MEYYNILWYTWWGHPYYEDTVKKDYKVILSVWRIVAANVCQNGRYIFRHGIFTLGPLRAQRVLSSPEPSVRLSGVRPYESHCDRGKVFKAINFNLHTHTFGVWGQCSIDFQTDPTKIDPVGGNLWKFTNRLVAEGCCRSLNALLPMCFKWNS